MKNLFLLLLLVAILSPACKKKTTAGFANEAVPMTESTVIKANGHFVSGDHPTSGKVSIQTGEDGKKYLSFVNFQTENGPDLRVYLSSNTSAADFVEAGKLKAISGNFFYELRSSVDYNAKNHLLIWCKKFDVLFGYAILDTKEGE